jgi:hypothetical protein
MDNTITDAEEEQVLKFNLLELVKDHRDKETEDCNVSLWLVRVLAEKAGLCFSEEETKLFV